MVEIFCTAYKLILIEPASKGGNVTYEFFTNVEYSLARFPRYVKCYKVELSWDP